MWILREVKKVTDALLVHQYRSEVAAALSEGYGVFNGQPGNALRFQLLGKALHEGEVAGEVG
jgi:hypothetical protein